MLRTFMYVTLLNQKTIRTTANCVCYAMFLFCSVISSTMHPSQTLDQSGLQTRQVFYPSYWNYLLCSIPFLLSTLEPTKLAHKGFCDSNSIVILQKYPQRLKRGGRHAITFLLILIVMHCMHGCCD